MILICILKIHFVTCNFQESHESRKPPAVDNLLPATTEPDLRISQMKSQQHHGSLSNGVLVARTSIDWHLSVSPQAIEDLIDEAAVLHSEKCNVPVSKTNFGLLR